MLTNGKHGLVLTVDPRAVAKVSLLPFLYLEHNKPGNIQGDTPHTHKNIAKQTFTNNRLEIILVLTAERNV